MKRLLYQAFIVSSVAVLAGISVSLTLAGASDIISNGALVAVSDFLEISQFESVDFDPLSNDEVMNPPAVLIDYSDPSYGSILVNNDGSLSYYPNKIFIGDDSLSYTIEDAEGNQAVGLVTITITPDEVFKVYPSDRLARLIVDSPFIYSDNASQVLQTWTQTVYKKAKDEFDFIIFVQNCNNCISDFSGIFIVTSNKVEGIGLSVFNENTGWGAGTKLQGVLYLTNIRNLRNGPSLHELLHNWANYVIPPNIPNIGSHWGVAGTPGQLGGFDPETLINLGGDLYQATNGKPGSTSFGVNANGGNSLPYSALELYLMGLVPAFEVPTVPVAVNPQAVDFANGIFSADSFVETTIYDLIDSYGPRVPAYGEAQNRFRILTILVYKFEPRDEEWRSVDSDLELFVREGSDDDELLFNFFEATGGRGVIEANSLSTSVDTDVDGVCDAYDPDDDNDGMTDVWENQYGLNPIVNDASGDLDNDGYSNYQEYRSGTAPNDPNSIPKTKAMPWIPLLLLDD